MESPKNFSMEEAMRLANSPAGKQLISMLQQQNQAELQKAMANAASGNYDAARSALSSLLDDPAVKALLKQMGG